MSGAFLVLVNVAVAAVVGGVTNHIAIKMLFHPRRKWRWGGWNVPFTPGLIPKRKNEIAVSLGHVVAGYLVTPDGIRELLDRADYRRAAADRIAAWIEAEAARAAAAGEASGGGAAGEAGSGEGPARPEAMLEQLIRRWAGDEAWAGWKAKLPDRAGSWAAETVLRLWKERDWGSRPLKEWIPGWEETALRRWPRLAAKWGLSTLREYAASAEGQQTLRRLASGLMDRAGGWMGFLAGVFVDEDKLVQRLTPFIVRQLGSDSVRDAAAGWLAGRLDELGGWTTEEAVRRLAGGRDPELWLAELIRSRAPWARWIDSAAQFPISRWLDEHRPRWREWVDRGVDAALTGISVHADKLIAAVRLPDLVRTQVERFPVERLEQVILSVSGREFRSITWLGVILGGLIGLVQSVVLLIWR